MMSQKGNLFPIFNTGLRWLSNMWEQEHLYFWLATSVTKKKRNAKWHWQKERWVALLVVVILTHFEGIGSYFPHSLCRNKCQDWRECARGIYGSCSKQKLWRVMFRDRATYTLFKTSVAPISHLCPFFHWTCKICKVAKRDSMKHLVDTPCTTCREAANSSFRHEI
jgi:hypothetical protein